MNCILAFMLLGAAIVVSGQSLAGIDKKQIPAMLKNKDLVNTHANCVIASEADSKVKCDKVGAAIRAAIYQYLKTGTCGGCKPEDEGYLVYTVKYVLKHYPAVYTKIQDALKATPEQKKKFEEYLAKTPLPDGLTV